MKDLDAALDRAAPPVTTPEGDAPPPRGRAGRTLKIVLAVVAVAAVAFGLWRYWGYAAAHPSTDDAYLSAGVLDVAAQVGGRVETVAVAENQRVAAGDVLFTLERADYEAQLDIARATLEQADQSTGVNDANVAAAEARLAEASAALSDAETVYARQERLFALGDVAQAALDTATTARDRARSARAAAEAAVAAARAPVATPDGVTAARRTAEAQVALAELDLARTEVTAPADGWIANVSLRPGQYVAPGQPLFALVEDGAWWVDANFKETDLGSIRPGQPAEVSVDMYPGLTLRGTVESLGAGSGASFSLLPAQNASGNWVKVTQRFPVRIALSEAPADPAMRLRVGASTTVTVDTGAAP